MPWPNRANADLTTHQAAVFVLESVFNYCPEHTSLLPASDGNLSIGHLDSSLLDVFLSSDAKQSFCGRGRDDEVREAWQARGLGLSRHGTRIGHQRARGCGHRLL